MHMGVLINMNQMQNDTEERMINYFPNLIMKGKKKKKKKKKKTMRGDRIAIVSFWWKFQHIFKIKAGEKLPI